MIITNGQVLHKWEKKNQSKKTKTNPNTNLDEIKFEKPILRAIFPTPSDKHFAKDVLVGGLAFELAGKLLLKLPTLVVLLDLF